MRATTCKTDVFHSNITIAFLALFSEQGERMRLSTIFELLLILLLVAFAAYGRVIGERNKFKKKIKHDTESTKLSLMKI